MAWTITSNFSITFIWISVSHFLEVGVHATNWGKLYLMGSSTKHSLSGTGKKVIKESRTSDSSTSGALMAKLQDTWGLPEWFKRQEVDKVVLRGDKPIYIILPTWLYTDWGKHQGKYQREGIATKSIAWEKWEANMGSIPYAFHMWLGIALDIFEPRRPQRTLFCSLK